MEVDARPNRMLTEREYAQLIAAKDARRDTIFNTMVSVNEALTVDGITEEGAEIAPGWKDVHSFFLYEGTQGNRVLHVRVEPVEDDTTHLRVSMRELDRKIMIEERTRTSTGDEHQAEVRIILPETLIPNDPDFITQLVKKELAPPKNGEVLTSTRFSLTD